MSGGGGQDQLGGNGEDGKRRYCFIVISGL